jgi:hypothetical protein
MLTAPHLVRDNFLFWLKLTSGAWAVFSASCTKASHCFREKIVKYEFHTKKIEEAFVKFQLIFSYKSARYYVLFGWLSNRGASRQNESHDGEIFREKTT